MTNEEAACQFHAVLMEPEPEPVSRLRKKYHSLRRQVYLIQSISVLFLLQLLPVHAPVSHLPADLQGKTHRLYTFKVNGKQSRVLLSDPLNVL